MTRRILAALIVLSWLGTLGWLAARRMAGSNAGETAAGAARLAPGASFFSVQIGERQIGTAGVTYDTLSPGVRITEVLSLDLATTQGQVHRVVLRNEARLSSSLRLLALETKSSERGQNRTRVISPSGDSAWAITLLTDGGRSPITVFPATEGLAIASVIPLRLAASGLREGTIFASPTIDPVRLIREMTTSRVGRDTLLQAPDSAVQNGADGKWRAVAAPGIRTWPIQSESGGLASVSWVDDRGRLIRQAYAYGVTLERSPFEVNYTNYQQAIRNGTAVLPASLPGSRRLVDAPERPDTSATDVIVVLGRADGPAWPGAAAGFAGGRQSVAGDTVRIARYGHPGVDSTPPRHLRNIGGIPPADSLVLREALQSALRAAREDPDTVRRLVRWVARAVQSVDMSQAPTGIVTVARERRGGLEGRVELLVALCRLAGIPARAVSGVDLSHPDLPSHAWAEVWRNGWLAVDPTFGDVPASAYLLRVTEGAAARPLALVPLIGSLRTTMVVSDPAPRRR